MPSDTAYHHRPPPLITVSGALISYIHTFFGLLAFGGALFLALALHYHKVVKNGVAGWPQEYWPSVSATIGDWYPERNIFQIGIALMSGPRFALVLISSMLVSLSKPNSFHARILLVVGILRTFACGGWVYVTSSDDHDVHDIMMGAYLILTPPWMFITSGSLTSQPNKSSTSTRTASRDALAAKARKMRRLGASAFFGMMPFMVVFFYRHKVLKIPGAYTHYAFFEWGLIIFDLLFDFASMYDLSRVEIQVVEASSSAFAKGVGSGAEVSTLPEEIFGGAWLLGGTEEAVASGAWSTAPTTVGKRKERMRSSPKKQSSSAEPLLSDLLSFLSESYISFLFWTSLTGLHPEIFFFSVYNMGVGGHEALLVIQLIALSVAMLPFVQSWLLGGGRPSVRLTSKKAASSPDVHVGRLRPNVLSIIYAFCLASFLIWPVQDALLRLIATALSCVGFSFLTAIEWGRAWEVEELERKSVVWLIGLLLSSLSKYANHSNNPAWSFMNSTNGGHNLLAVLLAAGAIGHRLSIIYRQQNAKLEAYKPRKSTSASQATVAACSLGALTFAYHALLSDSGSLIAWTWTGYPVSGPMAISHGCYILLASSLALIAALHLPTLTLNPLFWLFGVASMYVVYAFEDWLGFSGALGLSIFLPPLALPILQLAMSGHPIKIMWLAWLVTDLLAFLQVLTAAYAFVPGGKVMRERTGLMMAITMTFIVSGLFFARRHVSEDIKKSTTRRTRKVGSIVLLVIALMAQIIPAFRAVPASAIQPAYAEDRVFTAGIWTVHFSLDQSMWDSSRRMASLLKELKLDVVGLLETDLHRTVFGNRDLTQYLAQELGMYADVGPGPDKHTWGAALLSKFPIINSTHHLLPSPNGELAPAIHAVLDIYGVLTNVIVSHNGQEEDPLDRELQTTKLAEILRSVYPHPAVFLGYVVTKPHAKRPNPYEILFTDGRIFDVDAVDEDRWCQYIGFRALERLAYVRVSRFTVTDTELQTAKFRVPPAEGPAIPGDQDVLPFRTMQHPGQDAAWAYPMEGFFDPPALVYAKHKYSPFYYPLYFNNVEKPLL